MTGEKQEIQIGICQNTDAAGLEEVCEVIRAAQDAINRHFVEIDPEDIDTPRKIRAALTDIINAIYWDIAEDITPRATTTA